MWGNLSESLAKEVAYIPLDIILWLRLHGSKVTNYTANSVSSGYADLGQVGVAG